MKKILLLSILLAFSFPLLANESDAVVAVHPMTLSGDLSLAQPVAETVRQTLLLSLRLIGRYQVAEPLNEDWETIGTVRDACSEWGLDSVITGTVQTSANGFSITLSLYDRRKNGIILSETISSDSFLDIFVLTDELTLSLLEGMSDEHLAVGSLLLVNEGPSRDFYLEVNGEVVGQNIHELNLLPVGPQEIRIYEIARNREIESLFASVIISETEQTVLTFSLPDEEAYQLALSRPVLYAPGGTFQTGKNIYSPDPDDPGIAFNSFSADKFLLTAGEVVELMNLAADENLVQISKRRVLYSPPQGEAQELLTLNPGLFARTPYVYRDGKLSVKAGEAGKDAPYLTWYGAVFLADRLSRRDGLESCYDLRDWSCDFSRNGYRLPTETEFRYMAYLRENDPAWSELQEGKDLDRIWVWDWFQRIRFSSRGDSSYYGSDAGIHFTSMGFDWAGKRKNQSEEPDRRAGIRFVRTESENIVDYRDFPKKELKRNIIEPGIGFGLTFQEFGVNYLFTGVRYQFALNPIYSFGCGFTLGTFYSSGDEQWKPTFEVDIIPFVIGRRDRLAIGAYLGFLVLEDEESPSDLGIATSNVYGIPSLMVIYRNFSFTLQIGVPSWNGDINTSGMVPSQVFGIGYDFRF